MARVRLEAVRISTACYDVSPQYLLLLSVGNFSLGFSFNPFLAHIPSVGMDSAHLSSVLERATGNLNKLRSICLSLPMLGKLAPTFGALNEV